MYNFEFWFEYGTSRAWKIDPSAGKYAIPATEKILRSSFPVRCKKRNLLASSSAAWCRSGFRQLIYTYLKDPMGMEPLQWKGKLAVFGDENTAREKQAESHPKEPSVGRVPAHGRRSTTCSCTWCGWQGSSYVDSSTKLDCNSWSICCCCYCRSNHTQCDDH